MATTGAEIGNWERVCHLFFNSPRANPISLPLSQIYAATVGTGASVCEVGGWGYGAVFYDFMFCFLFSPHLSPPSSLISELNKIFNRRPTSLSQHLLPHLLLATVGRGRRGRCPPLPPPSSRWCRRCPLPHATIDVPILLYSSARRSPSRPPNGLFSPLGHPG